jgi:hypothetical protein
MRLRFVGDQSPFVMLNEVKHLGRVGEAPSRIESTFTPTAGSFADAQDDRIAVVGWAMPTIRFADMRELGGHSPPLQLLLVCRYPARGASPSFGLCHVERSAAQSRHLAANITCRPFAARYLGPQTRCFAFGNPLRAASGLGRNDKRVGPRPKRQRKEQNSLIGDRVGPRRLTERFAPAKMAGRVTLRPVQGSESRSSIRKET